MKKIFLSLSAIALLAVGTVSCGSDDSSSPEPGPGPGPGPEPGTEQANNTVRFNGVDTALDFSYYELVTRNYPTQAGGTVENVNVYQYPDGGYANGYYVNVGYNLTESGADTYHYALVLVPNSSIVVEGNSITDFGTPVLPHQAEEIYWASASVEMGGQTYQSVQGNVGTGSVVVNSLVLQENADEELVGTSNFVSQFSISGSDFNFKYDGATFLGYYLVNPTPAAKRQLSKSDVVKYEMAEAAKSLELSNVILK